MNLYLDFSHGTLRALYGEAGLEIPLERNEHGRLSESCRDNLISALQGFLKKQKLASPQRPFCAIEARGVSLRRINLPPSTREELQKLLRLKIESEFPLPPDELAWGYSRVEPVKGAINAAAGQEFMVVAVKKEIVEDYSKILSACGLRPTFTLGALARNYLRPPAPGSSAALDIGRKASELLTFEDGTPNSIRLLPWGGETITKSIQDKLGIRFDEAEQLKLKFPDGPSTNGELGPKIHDAVGVALDSLAGTLNGNWTSLWLTGRSARQKDLAAQLAGRLRQPVACQSIDLPANDGVSAAILGLKNAQEREPGQPLLFLQTSEVKTARTIRSPEFRKWAIRAAALALALIFLPYAEALLLKGRLAKKLAAIKAEKGRLITIDRELGFLQNLKKNQPPYLDALFLVARAAVPGTKIDSISMNRRGDLALRGSMRDSQQVVEFRSKLIGSGFFSTVAVEEQTPTPDRQKVTVRITAQWKSAGAREGLSLDSLTNEPIRAPGFSSGPMVMDGGGGFPMPPPEAFPPGLQRPPSGADRVNRSPSVDLERSNSASRRDGARPVRGITNLTSAPLVLPVPENQPKE